MSCVYVFLRELERQYREQVREVQEAAERDREAAREQVSTAANQALTQATLAHQEEARCKAKLASLSSVSIVHTVISVNVA